LCVSVTLQDERKISSSWDTKIAQNQLEKSLLGVLGGGPCWLQLQLEILLLAFLIDFQERIVDAKIDLVFLHNLDVSVGFFNFLFVSDWGLSTSALAFLDSGLEAQNNIF